jgi:hypothetical protein
MEVEPLQISVICFCEYGGEAWDSINVSYFCHQTPFETSVCFLSLTDKALLPYKFGFVYRTLLGKRREDTTM